MKETSKAIYLGKNIVVTGLAETTEFIYDKESFSIVKSQVESLLIFFKLYDVKVKKYEINELFEIRNKIASHLQINYNEILCNYFILGFDLANWASCSGAFTLKHNEREKYISQYYNKLKNLFKKINIPIKLLDNLYEYGNNVKNDDKFNIKAQEFFRKLFDHIENVEYNVEQTKQEVFIVHGHDENTKNKVARFLESIDIKPIILHEQASMNKTIIEKIESSTNVGFGIVLYTPCDSGRSASEKKLKPRARQNVIFEHGYLIGKIGRSNVCSILSDNKLEKPNDISGVVYISMNTSWEIQLAKELKKAGYEIDMNNIV